MKKVYQDHLYQAFSDLFDRSNDAPISQLGIEVKDGWYSIVERMCIELSCLTKEGFPDRQKIRQIKAKFGYLSVYLSEHDEEADRIVDRARESSRYTCEDCGAPGLLHRTKHKWYLVVCPVHAEGAEPVARRDDRDAIVHEKCAVPRG